FEHRVQTLEEAQDLAAALADPARQAEARQALARDAVGAPVFVEFDAHAATLRTAASWIRADWSRFTPGSRIVSSLVASAAMDSSTLQSRRLTSVESVLAPVSTPEAGRVRIVTPRVPDSLATY